jgi:hypothetical protein
MISPREVRRLIGFARAVIQDVDAAVAVSGANGDGTLLFVDLDAVNAAGFTRNIIADILDRAMVEDPKFQNYDALGQV